MLNKYNTVTGIGGGRLTGAPWLVVCCVFLCACGWCQKGKLTVNANVQGSIGLIFQDNPAVGTNGFCPLTNANTNNVGLDLGLASYTTGDNVACVQFFAFVGFYQVDSAFDIVVTEANSTSANYNLAASLSTTPPANVFWLMNLTNLSTTPTTFQNNQTYGQRVTETLRVIVNQNVPPQTFTETIFVQATAN